MTDLIKELKAKIKNRFDFEKKFEDIIFLKFKLNHLKDEIKKGHADLVNHLVEQELESLKESLKGINKTNSDEFVLDAEFCSGSGTCPLFYDLDSFLIDQRRCVEFLFRFTLLISGFKDDSDFKVQKCLDQIKPIYLKPRSNFVNMLLENYKWFTDYLNNDSKWINKINHFRTQSIHYEILNIYGQFKIKFKWNCLQKLHETPSYDEPNLPYFNMPVLEFTNSYMHKLDFFIEQIIKVNLDILNKKES